MTLHQSSGRWRYGLFLSLIVVLLWAWLPIAMKLLISEMSLFTIVWFRFLVSAILLYSIKHKNLKWSLLVHAPKKTLWVLFIACISLILNFCFYMFGLDRLTPNTATVVIQLAPILLLLGSVFVFKERFTRVQWIGLVLIIVGFALFFNNRIYELVSKPSLYTIGVILIFIAAVLWAIYSLIQKQLLKTFSSDLILFTVYVISSICLFPMSHPSELFSLDHLTMALLAFCALNTLLAYGCFAESLNHLEASRVGAILSITPLVTMFSIFVLGQMTDQYASEDLTFMQIGGALFISIGSMTCSLYRAKES